MKTPPLILASASPRRLELLGYLGCRFTAQPADVEESSSRHFTPREICQFNAHLKARAVAMLNPNSLVLGSDTLVSLGAKNFGKPSDMSEAIRTLKALQGKTHQVTTGMTLIHAKTKRTKVFFETTQVTFRKLSRTQIENYLSQIEPMDKAGAYAIQDHGEMIVEAVNGSFTNVIGLPLERLRRELENWPK